MNSQPIYRATAVWFVIFWLIAGALFGSFLIAYLTEPDPFIERGLQTEGGR